MILLLAQDSEFYSLSSVASYVVGRLGTHSRAGSSRQSSARSAQQQQSSSGVRLTPSMHMYVCMAAVRKLDLATWYT